MLGGGGRDGRRPSGLPGGSRGDDRALSRSVRDRASRRAPRRWCERAARETAFPVTPRLRNVELPRTTNQLRQAAAAVRDRSWCRATIDTKTNLRSYTPLGGPVVVFGPNNFPFAFNSIAGGDFVAAIAAGNPVIAKANTGHPGTTRLLGETAWAAARPVCPRRWCSSSTEPRPRSASRSCLTPSWRATGFTGSKNAGLQLKEAADRAGKPIYLEMSSVNPVFVLPERAGRARGGDRQGAVRFVHDRRGAVLHAPRVTVVVDGRRPRADLRLRGGGAVRPRDSGHLARCLRRIGNRPAARRAGPRTAPRLSPGDARSTDRATPSRTRCCGCRVTRSWRPARPADRGVRLGEPGDHARDVAQMVDIASQLEGNLTGCVYSGNRQTARRQLGRRREARRTGAGPRGPRV